MSIAEDDDQVEPNASLEGLAARPGACSPL